MAKRRGRGEGSIAELADGTFIAALDMGWQPNKAGKLARKRVTKRCATKKEAQDWLARKRRERDDGVDVAPARQTVEVFMTRWLDDVIALKCRASTVALYRRQVRLHITPALGPRLLSAVTPQDVQAFVARLSKTKSAHLVHQVHQRLSAALDQAVAWGLIPRNPAQHTTLPRVKTTTRARAMDEGEAARFLAALDGERLEALFVVALGLGLRRGELLGLQWRDIDLSGHRLRVDRSMNVDGVGELKTVKSRRVLHLPEFVWSVLIDHQERQRQERAVYGETWNRDGWVFVSEAGTPYRPVSIRPVYKRILKAAGLPDLRLHDLRHTCASLLASAGVQARTTQEILGHSTDRMTTQVYTHVFDSARDAAAVLMDEVLSGKKRQ